jgi:hypothetical protein
MTLIDRVLKQIEQDVGNQDFTAIEEILQYVPETVLKGFLSENLQDEADEEYDGQPTELEEWMDFDPDC